MALAIQASAAAAVVRSQPEHFSEKLRAGAPIQKVIIIIIIKKGWQCKAGRKRLTSYQSKDPKPTTPTRRMREEKGKTAGEKK